MHTNKTKGAANNPAAPSGIRHLGDFTTSPRVLFISAIAILVGTAGVISGVILLDLIRLVTNLAYFGDVSTAVRDLGTSPWGSPPSSCRSSAR